MMCVTHSVHSREPSGPQQRGLRARWGDTNTCEGQQRPAVGEVNWRRVPSGEGGKRGGAGLGCWVLGCADGVHLTQCTLHTAHGATVALDGAQRRTHSATGAHKRPSARPQACDCVARLLEHARNACCCCTCCCRCCCSCRAGQRLARRCSAEHPGLPGSYGPRSAPARLTQCAKAHTVAGCELADPAE